MTTDEFQKIKKLAVLALFSDDELMDRLVLKGGSVLDIAYSISLRASVDLDFSLEGGLSDKEQREIEQRARSVLDATFAAAGYVVFDLCFTERPSRTGSHMPEFWGGYRIEFKVIEQTRYLQLRGDERKLRVGAMTLGLRNRKKLKIDISKFEYCRPKVPREIDGHTVYVYSPEMVVFEKLRAICQQMPEYAESVVTHRGVPRARDFFDIHAVLTHFEVNLLSEANAFLLARVFEAKRVPLRLIGNIRATREFHKHGFASLRDTVRTGINVKDFDFYFNYVVTHCCEKLESLWNV